MTHHVILEYGKTTIDILAARSDVFIDLVTCPVDPEIMISGIKECDNVYDVSKYILFRTLANTHIIFIYGVLENKVTILKFDPRILIKEYIIYREMLIVQADACLTLVINLNTKKYIMHHEWDNLVENADMILQLAINVYKDNMGEYITKANIDVPIYQENCNILTYKKQKYAQGTITLQKHTTTIAVDLNNATIIYCNNKKIQLDSEILDIFNFSLDHILIITTSNMFLINMNLNASNYMEMYEFTLLELIYYINQVFYSKLRESYIVSK